MMESTNTMTETQHMMSDALARYLRERYPFETHRQAMRTAGGFSRQLWKGFAHDLGILGAALPESAGGLGGGLRDHALIMAELGKALAGDAYLSTVVIGGGLLARCGGKLASAVLAQIVAGDALIAFAYAEPQGRYDLSAISTRLTRSGDTFVLNGRKSVVRGAASATHYLVTARAENHVDGDTGAAANLALVLVPAATAGVRTRTYPTVDGAEASDMEFVDVRLPASQVLIENNALPLIEEVTDIATLALCAEGTGVMHRLYRDTVDYARERKQFGVAIASFQVLQHRLADMLMQLEQASAMTELVTERLDQPGANRQRLVSSAKVATAKACRFIGQNAIQLHGGMGMTDEMAVGHFFKRATVIESLFGTVDHHLRRYASVT